MKYIRSNRNNKMSYLSLCNVILLINSSNFISCVHFGKLYVSLLLCLKGQNATSPLAEHVIVVKFRASEATPRIGDSCALN